MKFLTRLLALLALLAIPGMALAGPAIIKETGSGTQFGTKATQALGFFGATPATQPTSSSQTALTDSTGGTAGATLAATVGVQTLTIPITRLATDLSTSAIDLLTNYTPGYAFKILKFDFVTTTAGTGSGASQVFNLEIGITNLTGGVLTVTLSSTDTIGKVTTGTAVTAANVGTASDTLSIEMAASGTVFTAGAGYFVIEIQNLDTANAFASQARFGNAIRSALVTLGLLKGS